MITAIIPARYASTRFPGKPLVLIDGITMIERVYRQAEQCNAVDEVIVATDDERIYETVTNFGGTVMMTSPNHQSGTDRCAEVSAMLRESDFIINIQGDEPFIQPEQIGLLVDTLVHGGTGIATLARKITDQEALNNPNVVKLIMTSDRHALYFSRFAIPFLRDTALQANPLDFPFYQHIGLYGFEKNMLRQLTRLNPSALEKAESLEQLRWLENGYSIAVGITETATIGIDTPEDLERIRQTSV